MAQSRKGIRRIVPLAGFASWLAIMLLLPDELLARAGGGEGYGGGGGGGGHGGGGSGGGGGGFIIYLLFELFVHHPIVGLILAGIVVFLYFKYRNDPNVVGAGAFSPVVPPMMNQGEAQNAVARLRAADPNFDEQAFYRRVDMAFNKIQVAWCSQNLSGVRPFISDGVHERFTLQFSEQKAEGWHDQMDDIQVHRIAIAELRSDGLFDELSVRIEASARDYHVSLADGKRQGGLTAPERFAEVWSFLRHRGAATVPNKAGLIEGNCPNCGAPVEMNQSANCTNCKALLRGGQYDWVLSEITQDVEWQGARHGVLPGVAALRARDPEFNAVELEDRASVVFWRKATADRTGKIDPLRKTASEAFCQAYAPTLRPTPDGQRQFFADCAVGSVQVQGVSSDGHGDRVIVEVRWSGKRVVFSTSQPPRIVEQNHVAQSLFVLWRKGGSMTESGKGISSAHCPGCGAPVSNSASGACDFCGVVLNDGSHGWILVDISNRNDARGNQVMMELR